MKTPSDLVNAQPAGDIKNIDDLQDQSNNLRGSKVSYYTLEVWTVIGWLKIDQTSAYNVYECCRVAAEIDSGAFGRGFRASGTSPVGLTVHTWVDIDLLMWCPDRMTL